MSNFSANAFQKGLGIPYPGCVPVLAAGGQGLLWAAAGAGIEQKQMCMRCSRQEALGRGTKHHTWNGELEKCLLGQTPPCLS